MYLRKRFSHIKKPDPRCTSAPDPAFLVYSVFRVTFGDGKYCLLNVSFISIVVDQTTFQMISRSSSVSSPSVRVNGVSFSPTL